jgi:heme/copper-type cytochrome/quinol oxidase subunit 3
MRAQARVLEAEHSGEPAVPNAVLGMALFLFTEVMLFCGLISAYLVLRGQTPFWPPLDQPRLPLPVVAVNTVVLLLSGGAMLRVEPAWRARGSEAARVWLLRTAVLGLIFLMVQGYEWARLIHHGFEATMSVYAGMFYATVGTHAVHVGAALVALTWGIAAFRLGRLSHAALSALRMFWLFVVLVWPVIYFLVYLW